MCVFSQQEVLLNSPMFFWTLRWFVDLSDDLLTLNVALLNSPVVWVIPSVLGLSNRFVNPQEVLLDSPMDLLIQKKYC